jgi:hypothetical protein
MAFFNFFKPKWAGAQMTETDRRMMFYYLQRKTSWSAWKREADWFGKFVAVLEKQMQEEPIGGAVFGTDWEDTYCDALQAHAHYKKAIHNLARGDRTIWLRDNKDDLTTASTIISDLYNRLVNHGFRAEQFMDGKYIDEMIDVLFTYYLVRDGQAGVREPQSLDDCATYYWNDLAREKFKKLKFPEPLPPVPEPPAAPLYRNGEILPVFGIYEPQSKDGCMNYLLGGIKAPWIMRKGRILTLPSPVYWRLIWEDTRYQDGTVPEVEQQYFPTEQMIVHVKSDRYRPGITIHADTNSACPLDGEWIALNDLNARVEMKIGEAMPPCEGRQVTWVWVKK